MVNIRGFINREKDRFRGFQRKRYDFQAAELEKEKARLKSVTEARIRKEKLEKDIQSLKKSTGPSKLQKFSKGLAKTITEAKKQGGFKGIDFGGSSKNNNPFGGSGFGSSSKPEKKKSEYITIKVKR